jgi:putative colanic acid biosynthesis UDP-glucose lipid carrier transferase
MKKELNRAGFSSLSKLKIVTDADVLNDSAPYFHLKNGFGYVVNLDNIITPFITQPMDKTVNRGFKRSMDILFSTVVILGVLSWLTPIIAILIKLSSRGPVFFLQKRNKRNGELFTCIKFRSMFNNADADILPAGKNDGRITPVGKFLRRCYLDELPQFFNVLLGDMSVVGPRPHMVSENVKFDALIKNYGYRHKVKPGLTGLAQVMGYVGETDDIAKMKSRVNMDIFYIRHWSVKMDIAILLRTLTKVTGLSS